MAKTTDEDLSQLEKDIRQLKIEYDQYFGGGKKRPPTDLEWRIDAMLKRYGDRGANMNFGQRFRYTNLTQTYSKYHEIFRKRLKQKEEGTVQRHFGAAAREIEKERKEKQSHESHPVAAQHHSFAISCEAPDHDMKKVEQLYTAFRHAKQQAGEATDRFTLETFQLFIHQKVDQLRKEKGAHEVEYIVAVEGKHVRLKARVKS